MGHIIYPYSVVEVDTFRIGTIGDLNLEDVKLLCNDIQQYFETNNIEIKY